jgi:hypothetical protein
MYQTIQIILPSPVSLSLAIPPRPRIAGGVQATAVRQISKLALSVRVDSARREIRACLSPVPGSLLLYGPADFQAAAGDTDEQHAERAVQILGTDPAPVLQALIDRRELPAPPPRVPREIANWRAKAVLSAMGKLAAVEAAIQSMPEPERTIVSLAWSGDAKLARKGKTVTGMAAVLGLSDDAVDELFIAADQIAI